MSGTWTERVNLLICISYNISNVRMFIPFPSIFRMKFFYKAVLLQVPLFILNHFFIDLACWGIQILLINVLIICRRFAPRSLFDNFNYKITVERDLLVNTAILYYVLCAAERYLLFKLIHASSWFVFLLDFKQLLKNEHWKC